MGRVGPRSETAQDDCGPEDCVLSGKYVSNSEVAHSQRARGSRLAVLRNSGGIHYRGCADLPRAFVSGEAAARWSRFSCYPFGGEQPTRGNGTRTGRVRHPLGGRPAEFTLAVKSGVCIVNTLDIYVYVYMNKCTYRRHRTGTASSTRTPFLMRSNVDLRSRWSRSAS